MTLTDLRIIQTLTHTTNGNIAKQFNLNMAQVFAIRDVQPRYDISDDILLNALPKITADMKSAEIISLLT